MRRKMALTLCSLSWGGPKTRRGWREGRVKIQEEGASEVSPEGPLKNHWVPEERERGPEPRNGNDWRLCVNASCLK